MNLVEIHILQCVPPANLNRDDTGSPKDTTFGGVRRARISSQAQKRAVRKAFASNNLVPDDNRAVRTRLLIEKELLPKFQDRPAEEARAVIAAALGGLGLGVKKDLSTEYLVFLGRKEMDGLAEAIKQHWGRLREVAEAGAKGEEDGGNEIDENKKKKKKKKEDARKEVPENVRKALEAVLNGGNAVDVALFGRMMADRPAWNVDAACQVGHAISTHRVDREFDFYTAVDDLASSEQTGAGMMGDVEFYTATFYRYANVNLDLLVHNLGGDRELALAATEAFVRAFILTLPSGKQNTFAAHSLPQFVAIMARENSAPRSLAAAFEKPVHPRADRSLTGMSAEALTEHWKRLDQVYGRQGGEWVAMVNLSDGAVHYHGDKVKPTLDDAIRTVMERVRPLLGGV